MKVGIIGLPQTGKKTLFQVLMGSELREQAGPEKPIPGIAEIIDSRFDKLVAMYAPKKAVAARIELVLLPKITQENITKGDIFNEIADVDALCHVIRAFEDDAVYHAQGSVDPIRDVDMVNGEFIMHDQIFVEKRIERAETTLRKMRDKELVKELDLMRKIQAHLEAEKPLRQMSFNDKEELIIRSYPFITTKAMILAFNVLEDHLGDNRLLEKTANRCNEDEMAAMLVCAKVESEIALLDSPHDRKYFLQDLGIDKPAIAMMTELCLRGLGLLSFFTVGKDEVRQWLVRSNSPAPVAAGVIHSDLQRGFIRAEVIKYHELMDYGSEIELKKAGKVYLQGKDYIIADGDIVNIRFKV